MIMRLNRFLIVIKLIGCIFLSIASRGQEKNNITDSLLPLNTAFKKGMLSGTIASEKYLSKLGITELTLSNDVKVVLKPTDFTKDEILLNAFSPGGLSLYNDKDFISASYADYVIRNSGLGDFDGVTLAKVANMGGITTDGS